MNIWWQNSYWKIIFFCLRWWLLSASKQLLGMVIVPAVRTDFKEIPNGCFVERSETKQRVDPKLMWGFSSLSLTNEVAVYVKLKCFCFFASQYCLGKTQKKEFCSEKALEDWQPSCLTLTALASLVTAEFKIECLHRTGTVDFCQPSL